MGAWRRRAVTWFGFGEASSHGAGRGRSARARAHPGMVQGQLACPSSRGDPHLRWVEKLRESWYGRRAGAARRRSKGVTALPPVPTDAGTSGTRGTRGERATEVTVLGHTAKFSSEVCKFSHQS